MVERFLGDKIALHAGDCLTVLPTLAENSIDSCVTDPPYHLTSIVQRFGANGAAPAQFGSDGRYARMSLGFMGSKWDGGDVAFRPETWAAVYRVLKPGAHLVAMGGTRTYHRLACAIEDAGFEIRDTISWLYGSGFPKSHDVSKGIDRRKDWSMVEQLAAEICRARKQTSLSLKEIGDATLAATDGQYGTWYHRGGHMFFETGRNLPSRPEWNRLRHILPIQEEFLGVYDAAEREVIRQQEYSRTEVGSWASNVAGGMFEPGDHIHDITAPATDAAREWVGWGTALKPACELIVLARKPLSEGTVAANVLKWGCGAINVNACRVSADGHRADDSIGGNGHSHIERQGRPLVVSNRRSGNVVYGDGLQGSRHLGETTTGRWPANLVHDGSDEVVAAFPESSGNSFRTSRDHQGGEFGWKAGNGPGVDDSGSAARFFYTAKADADDRLGSKHPTVKPLDLMQWLVRLVTPRGGVVLDCFAGTGTTGEAAWREGMCVVLIEAEAEYQADIRRRMALALAGPDERQRESIKARNLPRDDGPLFGGLDQLGPLFAWKAQETAE